MLHETAYKDLEVLEDWKLEHEQQDIRNRPLVTTNGTTLGMIEDLLVNRDQERVAAVRLDSGQVAAAEALDIHDDKVLYKPAGEVETYGRDHVTDIDDETIKLVEEQVAIGKRAVVGDTIRVSSKVVTDTVTEDVTTKDETAYVRTHAKDEVISASEADALLQGKEIEVTEVNEVPVVAKRAVVTGEVEVSKTVDKDVESVSETVRRTVVEVEETEADA